jgi:acetoacetyl-CoA synthetase
MSSSSTWKIEFEPMSFCDPVYIMFTSGTTGPPKCIVQGFGVTLNHLKEHILHFDVRAEDVVFTYSSLSWMMWNYLMGCLAIGSTLVLYDGSPLFPAASSMWTNLIEQCSVSVFFASARYLDALCKDKFVPSVSALRMVSSTGSPLAPATAEYFRRVMPTVLLTSGSGGTELSGSVRTWL